ncbi:MAG: hypothetical protein CL846_02530 [Crocinitomicaceae bacterium]|nr:hypothetical protein [Crocinitomicaceae bacterium]|tara:strand:- start:1095 stop:1496 length:402 start_codon:yes stop_codon:yes gene_type:complete
MKYIYFILFINIQIFSISQSYVNHFNTVEPDVSFENIHVKKLFSDSNSTTFAIWVKQKVKMHKHLSHVENIYVTEGSGNFYLGDSTFLIKSGDLIVVPKNSWHGVDVNSENPLKVLSIQSPEFIGNDRVFKEE